MGESREVGEKQEVTMDACVPGEVVSGRTCKKLSRVISKTELSGSCDDFNNNAIRHESVETPRSDDSDGEECFLAKDSGDEMSIFDAAYQRKQDSDKMMFSPNKFVKFSKDSVKMKSHNGLQSNIMKLSPIKIITSHPKDLGTKIKNRKDPLPMKLRALPRSFWLQPNEPAPMSPAPGLPPLTPISAQRDDESTASPNTQSRNSHCSVVSDANTELLFSLFRSVESNKRPIHKRGRPKKMPSNSAIGGIRDDDPCLVPSGLLPSLTPTRPQPDNPKNLNYSQLLNELVFQL